MTSKPSESKKIMIFYDRVMRTYLFPHLLLIELDFFFYFNWVKILELHYRILYFNFNWKIWDASNLKHGRFKSFLDNTLLRFHSKIVQVLRSPSKIRFLSDILHIVRIASQNFWMILIDLSLRVIHEGRQRKFDFHPSPFLKIFKILSMLAV